MLSQSGMYNPPLLQRRKSAGSGDTAILPHRIMLQRSYGIRSSKAKGSEGYCTLIGSTSECPICQRVSPAPDRGDKAVAGLLDLLATLETFPRPKRGFWARTESDHLREGEPRSSHLESGVRRAREFRLPGAGQNPEPSRQCGAIGRFPACIQVPGWAAGWTIQRTNGLDAKPTS
jgi:hypothetical protein